MKERHPEAGLLIRVCVFPIKKDSEHHHLSAKSFPYSALPQDNNEHKSENYFA